MPNSVSRDGGVAGGTLPFNAGGVAGTLSLLGGLLQTAWLRGASGGEFRRRELESTEGHCFATKAFLMPRRGWPKISRYIYGLCEVSPW